MSETIPKGVTMNMSEAFDRVAAYQNAIDTAREEAKASLEYQLEIQQQIAAYLASLRAQRTKAQKAVKTKQYDANRRDKKIAKMRRGK